MSDASHRSAQSRRQKRPSSPEAETFRTEETYKLWHRLADFPASQTNDALRYLMEWIARQIAADNVIWIGAVRVLRGEPAQADAFLGWRLRARVALRPDPEPYRKQLASYYDSEHYGKLTPTYYKRSHEEKKDDHVGMDSRASMAGTGRFRVHRLRDGWIDFAVFRRTSHYKLYYRDGGISDRIMIGFPVTGDLESFFLIDRFHAEGIARRRHFTLQESRLAGDAVRGMPGIHRRLFLGNGLLMGDKPLSPMESQVLQCLLTGLAEKEIAAKTGQKPSTLHKYVTQLYARFKVKSRPELMALW